MTRRAWYSFLLGVSVLALAPTAEAETCGGVYRVQPGDSLSVIAERQYGNFRLWTEINRTNRDVIGTDPDLIHPDDPLLLQCINGRPDGSDLEQPQQAAAPVQERPEATTDLATVRLLTAGGYAPFTDQEARNGGMITDLITAAMRSLNGSPDHDLNWINDWSAHLSPLLSEHTYDAGFPWLRPNCANDPDNFRCSGFLYSDPMFEMLVLLFHDTRRPVQFANDADIEGKTLCRPAGYYTHDLEKDGRNWLSEDRITLEQPDSVDDCFRMLVAGEVDAVALNEFTGRTAIREMDLSGRVEAVRRPLSIEGLHAIVHKAHPQAEEIVAAINYGLATIEASGEKRRIVEVHLSDFWSQQEAN